MNYNTDGFNERSNYIHNANDKSRLDRMGPSNFDNSFAQMRVSENKPDVETVNHDTVYINEEVSGTQDNFVLRTNNMRNVNSAPNSNNPVFRAMNKNMFKK